MIVKELVANALYQRHCEAQGMYALTWDRLPADRKFVWMAVAETALSVSLETLREVKPWQSRNSHARKDERRAA